MGADVHIQRISDKEPIKIFREQQSPSKSNKEIYEEKIVKETPVNQVNFESLSDDQAKAIFETLLDANEDGLLNNLERITADKEWAQSASVSEDSIAGYGLNERAIYFNPDEFTSEQIKELHENGWVAADSIEGAVYHELGHHQHLENMRESIISTKHLMEHIEEEGISPNIEQKIKTDISEYATKIQPYEFIAEVFAMEKTGEDVPGEIKEEYEQLFNPKP